jgi:hypothetical protein
MSAIGAARAGVGRQLADALTANRLVRATYPFAEPVPERKATWLAPRVVAEVIYQNRCQAARFTRQRSAALPPPSEVARSISSPAQPPRRSRARHPQLVEFLIECRRWPILHPPAYDAAGGKVEPDPRPRGRGTPSRCWRTARTSSRVMTPARAAVAHEVIEPGQVLVEDLPVEEQQGPKGLILRGGSDPPVHGQGGESVVDIKGA